MLPLPLLALAAAAPPVPAPVPSLVLLGLVACGVALVCWYARLPYLIALFVAGLAAPLLGFGGVSLSREAILLLFLPPLIFEGSLHLPLGDLRRYALPVGLLAILGTLITAGGTAGLAGPILGLPWQGAALLGVILAATDPVSVLALFKQLGAPRGLRTLMEGESLLNDGLGIVLYVVLLQVLAGGPVGAGPMVSDFLRIALGGAALGLGAGVLAYRLLAGVNDRQLEVMATLVLAYGAYIGAESLHLSGVLAVVAAGLVVGNFATERAMSANTRVSMVLFWDLLAYLANSGLFLLMGVRAAQVLTWSAVPAVAVAFAAMMLARAPAVWGLIALANRAQPRAERVPGPWTTVLWWGGVRGSIPVALALGLPHEFARWNGINLDAVVFGVVVASLLLQGLTVGPLMRRVGVGVPGEAERAYEEALAAAAAANAALRELERLRDRRELSEAESAALRGRLQERLSAAETELERLVAGSPELRARRATATRERLILAGKAAVGAAARLGEIGEEAAGAETRRLNELFDAAGRD